MIIFLTFAAKENLREGPFCILNIQYVCLQTIAATNSADILDPALMRSGRLDRKIEFPHPTEKARARILQIHSRKKNVHPDVNFEELARSTDDFNGAQLKAVCVEAGMLALRRDATEGKRFGFSWQQIMGS
ncbi:Regulatory particle triple-A ATPase 5A [Heracleum sosnowskyi]|uniref:Regulatory particle triple-A ATPase 5A n=1 Tax=Heracleum sosnowskyi TaxID=360622 RepID=A0AAD8GQU7_9APIA|nr:Regulatory particle triple-A ATPase 5A [Heracleum sosnowskyi]